jgi:hypothetical protein
MACKNIGFSEHKLWKYSPSCYIDPNEERWQVFMMAISVAPNVSLVLSELTTSVTGKSGEWNWIKGNKFELD